MEGSETAKQKTTKWQPGSAQAQFGINEHHKNALFNKFLRMFANHQFWWRCQH
ncbi:conserved hypothetical protein [Trichormus variabilis ATCC 29413]|uniref:Uncharacterized protein n=1 Tax=Trichormus variabilis (strain ATCC 29413 / PCC 7937) TaxID=240292 RepID=Q3MBZ6_TRIV2|nr:conserved hypothetical protein [Trichormus variabilis ATCC 29413]